MTSGQANSAVSRTSKAQPRQKPAARIHSTAARPRKPRSRAISAQNAPTKMSVIDMTSGYCRVRL